MNPPSLREICAKATKGPWQIIFWRVLSTQMPVIIVASCANNTRTRTPERAANAQLIARLSPETALAVYEALTVAKESLNAWNGDVALKEYQSSPEIRNIDRALNLLDGRTAP